MKLKTKRGILNFLKILVSFSLLSFLLVKNLDDLKEIRIIVEELNLFWLFLAASFYFLSLIFILFRWEILLKAQGINISRRFLLKTVLIGFFYNNLLPTNIGGDAYRVYNLHRQKSVSLNKGVVSVFIERLSSTIIGFLFILAFIVLSLGGFFEHNFITPGLSIVIFLVGLAIILLISVLINPCLFKIDVLFRKISLLSKIRPQMKRFQEAFSSYWQNRKKALFISILYSFFVHFLVALSYYFISISIGLGLKFISFLFILPFSSMMASLPISIGGLGVRENTLVFILSLIGISENKAIIFSLLVLLVILFNAFIGGIVYLLKNILFSRKKLF